MSTLRQTAKKNSDFVPGNLASVAEVINLQVASNPAVGDRFSITPIDFVVSSTAGSGAFINNRPNTWQFLSAANVSGSYSAISAAINLAMPAGGGVAAAGAAGSRTDIALTADLTGMEIEAESHAGSVVFTETTGNTGGHVMGEGHIVYSTSAGNTVRVKDPAELTNVQSRFPSQRR